MIILGVDPGTRITGFGLLHYQNRTPKVLDYGTIRPSQKDPIEMRYYTIFTELDKLIQKFKPVCLSVETQFVNKNVQSAIKLGMARGACLLAAAKNQILVKEYAPTLAKKAVMGKGHASKVQVQKMIQLLLNLKQELSEDISDAFSLAFCHIHALHLENQQAILKRRL